MKNKIILLAAGLMLFSCQKKEEKVVQETTVEASAPTATLEEHFCFLNVVSKDSTVLNIVQKGDSISGTFKWLPAEKDRKVIDFKGILNGSTVTATGNSKAEGSTNKEELIFTLEHGQAKVKFGEMAEGKDGIWHYKDVKATSDQVLNKVDCQ